MKLSSSILIGLLVFVATVLSTGVDARRNRGLQDMDAEYGGDSDVVYADGPPSSPSSYSSSSSSGKGDCGDDGSSCCFGDMQLCFQGLGCDVKIVNSEGKPLSSEEMMDMNITCTKNCGDEHQPCCYDLCPGRGSKGSKGTGKGGGKGGSKGDSSSGGDDCDCKCKPGLIYDISTKTCRKCGRCEKGKKFANGIGTPLDSELDEVNERAGGGDDLKADQRRDRPMCYPCCEGDTCDPGHVCTASGMCERCGEDRSDGWDRDWRSGSGRDAKRQPCCIKEEMVRVTKESSEDSCPSPKVKSGWCEEPEEEWVLKTVHKCNAGFICQADRKCSKCGDLYDACCDDGCTPANSECGAGGVCKCKAGFVKHVDAGTTCVCPDGFIEDGDGGCQSRCLAPVEPGPCRGSFPKFYFDSTTQMCKSFIYGGCLGNANRFNTEDDCMQTCQCLLDADAGPCEAIIPKFYFDSTTQMCKSFQYGGCGGNANRFNTEDDCMTTCA